MSFLEDLSYLFKKHKWISRHRRLTYAKALKLAADGEKTFWQQNRINPGSILAPPGGKCEGNAKNTRWRSRQTKKQLFILFIHKKSHWEREEEPENVPRVSEKNRQSSYAGRNAFVANLQGLPFDVGSNVASPEWTMTIDSCNRWLFIKSIRGTELTQPGTHCNTTGMLLWLELAQLCLHIETLLKSRSNTLPCQLPKWLGPRVRSVSIGYGSPYKYFITVPHCKVVLI